MTSGQRGPGHIRAKPVTGQSASVARSGKRCAIARIPRGEGQEHGAPSDAVINLDSITKLFRLTACDHSLKHTIEFWTRLAREVVNDHPYRRERETSKTGASSDWSNECRKKSNFQDLI
jgi:hypothetical protein